MIDLKAIAEAVNNAPSGSFIGITDYISDKGDVSSVTGQVGISYGKAKNKAIDSLKLAIETKDFEPIKVTGMCRKDANGEWNSRIRKGDMVGYEITFPKSKVVEVAKEVLESYENAEKKSNKVELSNKENGLYLESNTDNINISLLVQKQTYKELESQVAKANLGKVDKPKASHPESKLKEIIRKRFEPTIKAFTIRTDNFKKLTIGGNTFE